MRQWILRLRRSPWISGVLSNFCHSLAVYPWATHPVPLSLCFSSLKQRIKRWPLSQRITIRLTWLKGIYAITWHNTNICLLFLLAYKLYDNYFYFVDTHIGNIFEGSHEEVILNPRLFEMLVLWAAAWPVTPSCGFRARTPKSFSWGLLIAWPWTNYSAFLSFNSHAEIKRILSASQDCHEN